MSANSLLEVAVGSLVTPGASFYTPRDLDTTGAYAVCELLDESGVMYAQVNAQSLASTVLDSSRKVVTASATLTIPNSVPVIRRSDKFKLLWLLYGADNKLLSTYVESFSIRPATVHPFGVPDIVECLINNVRLVSVLPTTVNASVSVYRDNYVLYYNPSVPPSSTPVYDGTLFELNINNTYDLGIREAIQPYTVLWEYTDQITGERISEDGYLYHVNPSILSAAKELQQLVHRVRNEARLPETTIDLNVCIAFLKMGMDYFNGTGQPTYFTMQNATGAVRAHWMQASMVLLLRSQYLVEAERSFTMSGQSVSLDFDITQYYESMASAAQSFLDSNTPQFKQNLLRRGQADGDGNITGAVSRNVGSISVALSPVSNFYWMRYPRFKGW